MTEAGVTFKTADAAVYFCRYMRSLDPARFSTSGAGFWSPDKWRAKAESWASTIVSQPPDRWGETGAQRVARIMRGYRKGAGVRFLNIRCDCCGTALTAPESVAAGRGPRCIEASL